jgi:hypothetical protein
LGRLRETQYEALVLEMTPGKIEQAVLDGTVSVGLTYIPSPDPSLDYIEIGSFSMKIFGKEKWEKKDFSQWPFAIPTTELKIYSSEINALDMWPNSSPKRLIKYQFELLETALQTSASGATVLHCPDFIVKLYNLRANQLFQLKELPMPAKYKESEPIKVYLVCRKGSCPQNLEGKLAKFMRSLNKSI